MSAQSPPPYARLMLLGSFVRTRSMRWHDGVGTASCSVVMDEIYVHTVLERADGATWPGNTNDVFNTYYQQSNAAAPCSAAGTFRLRLSYVLRAPAGYSPAYSSNTIYSPYISVACGAAKTLSPEDQAALEQQLSNAVTAETVTFEPIQQRGLRAGEVRSL